ncbi:MAG TPA: PA14 domain-containing protein [Opitutaceae bacterium]
MLPSLFRPFLSSQSARLAAPLFAAVLAVAVDAASGPVIDRIATLRAQVLRSLATHPIDLHGSVWHVDAAQGRLILHDHSATAELELDLAGIALRPGDRVRIHGISTITSLGPAFRLSRVAVVDHDGRHPASVRLGSLELKAGRHPLRLDWFNAGGNRHLSLEYEGPGIERQQIPDAALERDAPGDSPDASVGASGLAYRSFEGRFWCLPPAFDPASAVASGTVDNFDLAVASREQNTAIQFSGMLRVPRDGTYTFRLQSDDGARLFLGPSSLHVTSTGPAPLPAPQRLRPGQLLSQSDSYLLAEMEGRITSVSTESDALRLELSTGSGRTKVELPAAVAPTAQRLLKRTVRITGVARADLAPDGMPVAATLFVQGLNNIHDLDGAPAANGTQQDAPAGPLLISAEQVNRLATTQPGQELPVRLKGVVTSTLPELGAVVLQDATRGVYVTLDSLSDTAVIGDYLEIEGTAAPGEFSPFVRAHRVTRLGSGQLPEPVRPTPDQLLNGSLHCQYVEIEGFVTAVQRDVVTLFTRAGKLRLQIEDQHPEALRPLQDSLVRMRGCLFSRWDLLTRRIIVGMISLNGAAITVEQQPPSDLFAGPAKPAAELLQFDPRASPFQRTKIAGQVVHARGNHLHLMDGPHGIRVSATAEPEVRVGDLVEVVGFPEFSGPSPVILESVVRKTGESPPPPPRRLAPDELLDERYDSTLVSIDATLLGAHIEGGRHSFELQSDRSHFVARLDASLMPRPVPEIGSKLALTGVYVGIGSNRALGKGLDSFELLLNSGADIRILARPPWWTLRRLLLILGALAGVLVVALVWIGLLRRQVAERTAQLAEQIRERQRVEQQRAIEQERARLAHDLHDELGAGLTEVSMLGTLARTHALPADKKERHLAQLTEIARRLVSSLDEIVWAVNPRYDSVASFLGYYTSYAQRFLGLASIKCRLDVAENLPETRISSGARHGLFLALKEVLNNVVRHAQATEVLLRIHVRDSELVLSVSDNGRGLGDAPTEAGMDGLQNTRTRLAALGGRCDISSSPATGTTVELVLPI